MSNETLHADESSAAFDALSARVIESIRLEKLSNRELVFEVAHSRAADFPAVAEMMNRLWAGWADQDCPPDCLACKQEMRRG